MIFTFYYQFACRACNWLNVFRIFVRFQQKTPQNIEQTTCELVHFKQLFHM